MRDVWEPEMKNLGDKLRFDARGNEREFLGIIWAALIQLGKERFIQQGKFRYQHRSRSGNTNGKKEKYIDWRWSKLSSNVSRPKVGQTQFTS
jgi:hypothetical protein